MFRSILNIWCESEKVRARKKLRLHGALMGRGSGVRTCAQPGLTCAAGAKHTGFQILRKETNAKFLMDNY